jgi:hypothetical protein
MKTQQPLATNKLERLPNTKDVHIWADFVELQCVTSIDGMISKSIIVDRIGERSDVGENVPDEVVDSSEEYDFESLEETRTMPSSRDTRIEREIEDVFQQLKYRSGVFSTGYPFEFSQKGSTLILRDPLNSEQKLYLFLLIASNLWCLKDKSTINAFTDIFEVVSLEALKSYLPPFAEVYLFGTNSYDKAQRYTNTLWHKIKRLAEDIHEVPVCTEDEFSRYNSGDGGLDIVAWLPIGDINAGLALVFGQCACTDAKWSEKQHSSSRQAWSNRLRLTSPPTNMVFIPYCFRDSAGNWHDRLKIMESVVVDRLRLMYLMKGKHGEIIIEAFNLVEAAVSQKMPTI